MVGNRQRTQSWAGSSQTFGGSRENLSASQTRTHSTSVEHYQPVLDGAKERQHHGSVPQDVGGRSHHSRGQGHDLDQYEYMNGRHDGTEPFSRSANDTFNEFIGKINLEENMTYNTAEYIAHINCCH